MPKSNYVVVHPSLHQAAVSSTVKALIKMINLQYPQQYQHGIHLIWDKSLRDIMKFIPMVGITRWMLLVMIMMVVQVREGGVIVC